MLPSARGLLIALVAILAAGVAGWVFRGRWDAGVQAKAIAAARAKQIAAEHRAQEIAQQRDAIVRDRTRQNYALPISTPKCLSPARVKLLNGIR
jgi:hypothetical protein